MRELYDYKRGGIFLYRTSISADFKFIDPVECAAAEAYSILREDGNLALRGEKSRIESFISMPSTSVPDDSLTVSGYMEDSFKYTRKSGTEDVTTKIVPFAPRYISEDVFRQIENNKETYLLIRNSLY